MADETVRVQDPREFSWDRIGAIIVAIVACVVFLFAFRFVFNVVCIDFLILRDFSICTKIKVIFYRVCCCRDISHELESENETAEENTMNDLEVQNISSFDKLSPREKKEFVDEHMLIGVVSKEKLAEWKNESDSDENTKSISSINDEIVCPICLNELKCGEDFGQSKSCTHAFHKDCIFMWIENQSTCPCCRKSLFENK